MSEEGEETKWWWLYSMAETPSCFCAINKTILLRLNVLYFGCAGHRAAMNCLDITLYVRMGQTAVNGR